MDYIQTLSLVCLSGIAVFMDLTRKKIPNRLILVGYSFGLAVHIRICGIAGPVIFLAGILLPLLLLWVLYYFRMVGAGDIKLLSALGGLLGPTDGFFCILYSFLIAGCISAILIVHRRILRHRLNYFIAYFREYSTTGAWKPYLDKAEKSSHLSLSVPVFFSILCHVGGVY